MGDPDRLAEELAKLHDVREWLRALGEDDGPDATTPPLPRALDAPHLRENLRSIDDGPTEPEDE